MKSAIQLAVLALVAAASGVRASDEPFTLRGSSPDFVGEELSDTCGATCNNNGDCRPGGFVTCGTCNKIAGTRYSGQCVADTCDSHCETDDDCNYADEFSTCGKCDLEYAGTRTYKTCVFAPETEGPTPSPVPYNPFPRGGSCKKSCRNDKDCQNGGFNPCGKCGKGKGYKGTKTHHRCYQPEYAEE
ncbi:hypothetical protein ACHAXT_007844 [Thalassiosira profunda]